MGAFWLHALTIGAVSTMILGVMTRAALGHTGRPLVVDPVIALAYLLLSAAAVVRVFGLTWIPLAYPMIILWPHSFGQQRLPLPVDLRADTPETPSGWEARMNAVHSRLRSP